MLNLFKENVKRFDLESVQILEDWFQMNRSSPYPDRKTKSDLAIKTNSTIGSIGKWFRNRRCKKNEQGQYEKSSRLSLESRLIFYKFFLNVSKNPTKHQFQKLSDLTNVDIKKIRARFSYLRIKEKN